MHRAKSGFRLAEHLSVSVDQQRSKSGCSEIKSDVHLVSRLNSRFSGRRTRAKSVPALRDAGILAATGCYYLILSFTSARIEFLAYFHLAAIYCGIGNNSWTNHNQGVFTFLPFQAARRQSNRSVI